MTEGSASPENPASPQPQTPTPSAAPAPKPAPTPVTASAPAAKPAGTIITRRDFLWVGWGSLAAFFGGFAASSARFFFPNVIYEPAQIFNAGSPKDYDIGVSTRWIDAQRMWIIRNAKGFYALWARCTHLGCTPVWFPDQSRFKCPCHGSNYTIAGDVIAGPAPRPLWRAKIELTATGELLIDKGYLQDYDPMRDEPPYFLPYTGS
jgi:cytochrome b6-f complex iron-sulfur subunit